MVPSHCEGTGPLPRSLHNVQYTIGVYRSLRNHISINYPRVARWRFPVCIMLVRNRVCCHQNKIRPRCFRTCVHKARELCVRVWPGIHCIWCGSSGPGKFCRVHPQAQYGQELAPFGQGEVKSLDRRVSTAFSVESCVVRWKMEIMAQTKDPPTLGVILMIYSLILTIAWYVL